MKKSFLHLAFALAALSTTSCKSDKKTEVVTASTEMSHTTAAVAYACPMDCEKEKTYSEVGKCPVCEMDLERVVKQLDKVNAFISIVTPHKATLWGLGFRLGYAMRVLFLTSKK